MKLADANDGHRASYQSDPESKSAEAVFRDHFGQDWKAHFVFNGTAANVLGLQMLVEPFQSVLVAETSHLWNDECGAPQRILGSALIPLRSPDGKLSPQILNEALVRRGDQHHTQIAAISISQPTELGTVYSLQELRALGAFCKSMRLLLHIDGSRLANAAVATGATFSDLVADAAAVSFGGTKNGLLGAEAVLIHQNRVREPDRARFFRKQLMQLPSKTRFLAVQFQAYLKDDLWRRIAYHQLQLASELRRQLEYITEIRITQPTQSNCVFAQIPRGWISKLREKHFFYVWNERTFECRLMLSWDSRKSDVDEFMSEIEKLRTNSGQD
jgi:threonine aldolase